MSSSASRLFSVVGAGYTGALLYANTDVASQFAADVARSVLRSLAKAPEPKDATTADDALRKLAAEAPAVSTARRRPPQVASLSALVCARTSAVAAHGAAVSTNGTQWAVAVGGVGVGAALLLRLSSLGLDEIIYVSRATFKQGVATLGHGLQSVSTALARVRTALSERIDALGSRVEEGLAVQAALAEDVAATRAGVGALDAQMTRVAHNLELVERQVGGVSAKQDFACRGIFLLCSVVSQALKDGGGPDAAVDPRAKLPPVDTSAPAHTVTAASLSQLLGSQPPAGADTTMAHVVPLTGTVQEQLAAISSLAAVNLNLAARA